MYLQWIVFGCHKFSQRCSRWQENYGVLEWQATFYTFPTHVDVRSTWLKLSLPWPLQVNEKKIDRLGDLPRFSWEEKVGHDIIGQGTFGPFFVTN